MPIVTSIVEGHGEVAALPALVHRIAANVEGAKTFRVKAPLRVKASSFLRDTAYFEKHVAGAAQSPAEYGGFVLIVLDCEDDCPAQLGPRLLSQARSVRSDVDYVVALAYREFETWFLEAAVSLRGVAGLSRDIVPPKNAAALRNAKGWLSSNMPYNYDPITHQLEFVRRFDMHTARQNRSFDRLFRRVQERLAGPLLP